MFQITVRLISILCCKHQCFGNSFMSHIAFLYILPNTLHYLSSLETLLIKFNKIISSPPAIWENCKDRQKTTTNCWKKWMAKKTIQNLIAYHVLIYWQEEFLLNYKWGNIWNYIYIYIYTIKYIFWWIIKTTKVFEWQLIYIYTLYMFLYNAYFF